MKRKKTMLEQIMSSDLTLSYWAGMALKQGAGERKKWGKIKKEAWTSIIALLSLNK